MLPLILVALALLTLPAAGQTPGRAPPVTPALEGGRPMPADVAIVVGNEDYRDLPQSVYSRADARAWADWLGRGRGLRANRITVLQDTTRADLLKALKVALGKVGKGGTLYLVFSGHGAMSAPEGGRRLLLGVDASASAPWASGVGLDELAREALKSRKLGQLVLIVDASFDGRGRDGLELVPGERRAVLAATGMRDLLGEVDEGRVLLWMAARGGEPAQALGPAGLGSFTWAALGALRGWADGELDGQPDGRVSLAEADAFTAQVQRQVGNRSGNAAFGRAIDTPLSEGARLEAAPDAALLREVSLRRRQERWEEAEALAQAEAAAFFQHTLDLAKQGGEEGRKALQAFIAEFGSKELSLAWPLALPEVRQARQLLARYGQARAPEAAVQAVASVAQQVQEESCEDLVKLEPGSMMGQLTAGQVACLERRVSTDRLLTSRERSSLVLIVNAQSRGDRAEWARLVDRHLDRISRADPNLVMQYAVHLFSSAPVERGEEVIHWAGVALENKHRWEAEAYVKNVAALLRLRAEAAYKLWIDAEQRSRQDSSEEAAFLADEWRGLAKGYAREWLDYLRAAGQDTERALHLCASAAGTAEFCRAQ